MSVSVTRLIPLSQDCCQVIWVFSTLYQLYFFHFVHCISFTVSTAFPANSSEPLVHCMIVSDTATAVTVYKKTQIYFKRKKLTQSLFCPYGTEFRAIFLCIDPTSPTSPAIPTKMAKARTHKFDLPAKGVFDQRVFKRCLQSQRLLSLMAETKMLKVLVVVQMAT